MSRCRMICPGPGRASGAASAAVGALEDRVERLTQRSSRLRAEFRAIARRSTPIIAGVPSTGGAPLSGSAGIPTLPTRPDAALS